MSQTTEPWSAKRLLRAYQGRSSSPTSADREALRFMADTIPGARHLVLPGVGHLTNLEASDGFNEAVGRFLER